MSRLTRLTPVTLTSFAAFLLLAACSDGGEGTGDPGDMAGPSAGTHSSTPGGSLNAEPGGSSGSGGQATTGGAAGVAGSGTAGVTSTGGAAMGGAAMGGAAMAGAPNGGSATGGAASGGDGGAGGATSGGSGGVSGGGGSACPDDGDIRCGGSCVDTDTDAQNCGGCGTKCSSGQTCAAGKCTGGTTMAGCSSITEFGTVSATIVVKNGQTYDGQCRRYKADPKTLGDGSQAEDQKPVFVVEDGGKLINVVLGAPAADGIHTKGSVTLENITWEDIGEDAMTIKESGTVILNGGSAKNGEDKVFQINAASTFRVSNFKASNAGKFIRQNGSTTFKTQVFIDKCDISNMDEAVFRTDSSSSTVSMTNSRYSKIGKSLFIGVAAGNITQSNNTQY